MIRAFTDADVDTAAEMLAERHARHRRAEPLLPQDVDCRAQIESEWGVDGATGVISADGYLFGRPDSFGSFTAGIGGHALRGDAEHARDLYAAAAAEWVDAGYRSHMVFVPAGDAALVDAWFRSSFGASAALGVRETAVEADDGDLTIRVGTDDDLRLAVSLDRAMHEAMQPAPSFSGIRQSEDEYLADWEGTWDGDEFVHFVAEQDGTAVGHLLLYRRPPDLRVPTNSIDLAAASTFPAARSGGVGSALTAHALTWAHEQAIPVMTIDWRMTNLLASRFWPRRGFRTSFLRLHRQIA